MIGKLKKYRLRKAWDFQKVIEKGERFYSKNFTIFLKKNNRFTKNSQEKKHRIGISIPQKMVRKAVERNKYKRQLKNILLEIYKEENNLLKQFDHWDFIFVIRNQFLCTSFKENKENLKNLLNFLCFKKRKRIES